MEPELFGLLQPATNSGSGIRAVTADTANVIRALEQPGPPPEFVRERLGEETHDFLARLVLDDVLEMELDGAFVSGIEAAASLLGPVVAPVVAGRVASLSRAALEHAETLGVQDPLVLSSTLYRFNARPAGPQWWQRFPDADSVTSFLQLDRYGGGAALLGAGAAGRGDSDARSTWHAWRTRPARGDTTYKLYVSPEPEYTGNAFRAVTAVMHEDGQPFAIKVASDLHGLLRSDKLVVYFDEFDDLERTAQRLCHEIAGMPPHGVPFTAELAADGLLSWGVEPSSVGASPSWIGEESWRSWVTNRLGAGLAAALTAGDTRVPPWWFATSRIELDGIDTTTWTPRPGWLGGAALD